MIQAPTVTLHFSQAIVQACGRLGIELPGPLLEALQSHPSRVPLSLQDELWRAIEAAQDDPLIGLRIGFEVQVGHLDSAGLLLMTCETLHDALDALIEYFPIIGEGSGIDAAHEGGGTRVRYRPGYEVCQATRAEAVIGCVVHLTRWMTGTEFAPREVGLRHQPRTAPERYEALLGCPVRFGTADYSLVYPTADLATPLIQANPAMRDYLQRVADEMLSSLSGTGIASEVRLLIRQHPHWGKERIADRLGISGRHLNRRLTEEGSTFKLLRDATLHHMAMERLRGDDPLREIAEALGFADESGFAKAFRRWAGISPAQFRRESS